MRAVLSQLFDSQIPSVLKTLREKLSKFCDLLDVHGSPMQIRRRRTLARLAGLSIPRTHFGYQWIRDFSMLNLELFDVLPSECSSLVSCFGKHGEMTYFSCKRAFSCSVHTLGNLCHSSQQDSFRAFVGDLESFLPLLHRTLPDGVRD